MKKRNTRRGFTLIELLVVVLIISILAAVAVPQYRKAVTKSQINSMLPLLNTAWIAYENFYLETGSFPETIDQLNIDVPWTGHYNAVSSRNDTSLISNDDWMLYLYTIWGFSRGACILHTSGPYAGAGFCKLRMMAPNPFAAKAKTGDLLCIEQNQLFKRGNPSRENGEYCKKLFHVQDENKVANYETQAWIVNF